MAPHRLTNGGELDELNNEVEGRAPEPAQPPAAQAEVAVPDTRTPAGPPAAPEAAEAPPVAAELQAATEQPPTQGVETSAQPAAAAVSVPEQPAEPAAVPGTEPGAVQSDAGEPPADGPGVPPILIQDPGQQTLELGAVETPFAPEAAAAAAATAAAAAGAVAGATPVVNYGDQDLDAMVSQLAATAPGAAAVAEPTLPGPAAPEAPGATTLAPQEEAGGNVLTATPVWPFLVYIGVWLAFAVALAFTMQSAAMKGNLFLSPWYPYFVWGGLALAVSVVPLIFGIWLWERSRHEKGGRGGLFASAFLKGAMSLFIGVVMWWAAFYVAVVLA